MESSLHANAEPALNHGKATSTAVRTQGAYLCDIFVDLRLGSKRVHIKERIQRETKFLLIPLFESWHLLLIQPATKHCAMAKHMATPCITSASLTSSLSSVTAKRK